MAAVVVAVGRERRGKGGSKRVKKRPYVGEKEKFRFLREITSMR